ncbi:MAG TPA: hypothetical protein VKS22_13670 [Candidatus Binataceae bacterium]|nr:hypothetical protein [Candidatus Binataceae bacterium]
MIRGFGHDASRRRRVIVFAGAALLLLVQSFAAAHYHQHDPRRGLTQNTRVTETDVLCAVCAFHLHSPPNPNAASALADASISKYRIAAESNGELVATFIARPASRAPPVPA